MDIRHRVIFNAALALFLLIIGFGCSTSISQLMSTPPEQSWGKSYGGGYNDYGSSVRQTSDNGYIITGGTSSSRYGDRNVSLIKTDMNGSLQWQKSYGGGKSDYGYAVIEPLGGGYAIAGVTESYGNGSGDVYLIRTDNAGSILWQKTFGGPGYDEGRALLQASDGGYIIAGMTRSYGNGSSDIYLVKTDAEGNLDWERTYGGPYNDTALSIEWTRGGGYIIAGGYGTAKDEQEAYLLKVDERGHWLWDKKFDAYRDSIASSAVQTNDRGYIVTGYVNTSPDTSKVCLIKVSNDGKVTWEKTYDGNYTQKGYKVYQMPDKGYLIIGMAGVKNSSSPGSTGVKYEGLLIRTNEVGNIDWQQTYGADRDVFIRMGELTKDNGLALVGSIGSPGDVETWDTYLSKLAGV